MKTNDAFQQYSYKNQFILYLYTTQKWLIHVSMSKKRHIYMLIERIEDLEMKKSNNLELKQTTYKSIIII